MHYALKLTQIGNSVGVILPKDALARMKLEKGDMVFMTDTPEGYQLAPYNPDVAEQIEAVVHSCVIFVTPFMPWPNERSISLGRQAGVAVAAR